MTISKQATDALLGTIKWLHPEYGGLIDFLMAHEDQLVAVGPVIQAAAEEGPSALAAAEKAAPDLVAAIKHFIGASPVGTDPKAADIHAEKLVRQIAGAKPLSPDQEREWMDRYTPSGDSRSGSG